MKGAKHFATFFLIAGGWLLGFSSPGLSAALMVEKNLFAQDRKPPSEEAAAPAPQAGKAGITAKAVQLDGVVIRGDVKKAIMRMKGQVPGADRAKSPNPYVTVKEGEKIGDMHVVKIDMRSVSLEKDGQIEVIKLFGEGKVVPPPPSVPAAPSVSAPQAGQAASPAEAVRGQVPVSAQPIQPQNPGGNVPAVGQVQGTPNHPAGHRGLLPPGQMQTPEDDSLPEDEGNLDEGGDEGGS